MTPRRYVTPFSFRPKNRSFDNYQLRHAGALRNNPNDTLNQAKATPQQSIANITPWLASQTKPQHHIPTPTADLYKWIILRAETGDILSDLPRVEHDHVVTVTAIGPTAQRRRPPDSDSNGLLCSPSPPLLQHPSLLRASHITDSSCYACQPQDELTFGRGIVL